MPEIRYYTVTQTREIRVSATSPINAGLLAERLFASSSKRLKVADKVNVLSPVRERSLEVREDNDAA
jgi:hypothetical protein